MARLLALVIIDTVLVVLLGVLVAGLLRSHADILRALHSLGAGVGDPSDAAPGAAAGPGTPIQMGPRLPSGRHDGTVHDVAGTTPAGDAVAVAVSGVEHLTLLVFLSSGCSTCQGVWASLARAGNLGLPPEVRPVVVTRGPDLEIPAEVAGRTDPAITVVMSSRAWDDYEVPGSPFFVLIDGPQGRRVGEGVAQHIGQAADLVRRAIVDGGTSGASGAPGTTTATSPRAARRQGPARSVTSLGGPEREAMTDDDLRDAGIRPGDPSLYPQRLEDVFSPGPGGPHPTAAPPGTGRTAGT